MENSNQIPIPVRAFQILSGMFNSLVLAALIKSDIIEALRFEAKSAEELAAAYQLNQNVLSRSLRFAAFSGIVQFADGKYSLTEIGRCFLKDVPGSLYGSASFMSAPPWRDSWNNFEHCLKTGEPAFDNVFGESFFDYLDSHQEYGKPFNNYMTAMTTMVAPLVAEAYNFSEFKTICDVGGGQGILLKAILEKHQQPAGILFDIESALEENVLNKLANRVEIISGSFFEQIPPADCLMLKTVIHDWNDEDSRKILENCRRSLNPGGKIILIEQVVEEPFTQMALFYDLHMQVMLGGAERTEQEFNNLLQSAGLKLNRIIATKSPMKIIEASVQTAKSDE